MQGRLNLYIPLLKNLKSKYGTHFTKYYSKYISGFI